jgi:hypothetical protein
MKNAAHFLLPLLLTLMMMSCGNSSSPAADGGDSTSIAKTEPSAEKPSGETAQRTAGAGFEIENSEDVDQPTAQLFVVTGGKRTEVAKVNCHLTAYQPENFETYDIPSNAVAACGGWWAGAGDYFYLVPTGQGWEVFQGWEDEGQEDQGYHYKKVLSL